MSEKLIMSHADAKEIESLASQMLAKWGIRFELQTTDEQRRYLDGEHLYNRCYVHFMKQDGQMCTEGVLVSSRCTDMLKKCLHRMVSQGPEHYPWGGAK